jgi:hypothetical protein
MSWRCLIIVSSIFNYFFVSLFKVVVEIEALRGFGKREVWGSNRSLACARVVCVNTKIAFTIQEDVKGERWLDGLEFYFGFIRNEHWNDHYFTRGRMHGT